MISIPAEMPKTTLNVGLIPWRFPYSEQSAEVFGFRVYVDPTAPADEITMRSNHGSVTMKIDAGGKK